MNAVVEEINKLPEGWKYLPLKDAVHIILGQSPSSSTYNQEGDGLPFFQGKTEFGEMYPTVRKWCSEPKKIAEKEDILVSVRAPVGPTNLAPYECAIGRGLAALRPLDNSDTKYFLYLIRRYQNNLAALGTGTTFEAISGDTLKNFMVPIAPPEQQKRIVAKIEELFSHIDAGIEALKKAKQLLKQYRQSVLKAAVTGELTKEWREKRLKDDAQGSANVAGGTTPEATKLEPATQLLEHILKERRKKWEEQQFEQFKTKGKIPKDDKWKEKYKGAIEFYSDIEIPEEWIGVTTDQVFYYVTSGSRGWAKYYSDKGSIFLRMGNLEHYDVKLDLQKIQRVSPPEGAEGSRTKVEAGDSLISITADVGMVAIVPEDFEEAYINQHVSLARPVIHSMGLYLAWLLSGDFAKEQFKLLQRGATKVGLGLSDIKSVQFGLPPIEEQKEIVRIIEQKLSSIEHLTAELEQQLIKADKNKQSILASAFCGDLHG